MDTFFVFGAKYLFLLSPLLAGMYFLKIDTKEKKEFLIFFFISLPITFLLSLVAREMYSNPRPFEVGNFEPLIPHKGGNGFPSDHTLLTSSIAFGVLVFNRRLGFLLLAVAIIVGLSRVYVGVHHPIDIVGSALIAVFVAFMTHLFLRIHKNDTISS